MHKRSNEASSAYSERFEQKGATSGYHIKIGWTRISGNVTILMPSFTMGRREREFSYYPLRKPSIPIETNKPPSPQAFKRPPECSNSGIHLRALYHSTGPNNPLPTCLLPRSLQLHRQSPGSDVVKNRHCRFGNNIDISFAPGEDGSKFSNRIEDCFTIEKMEIYLRFVQGGVSGIGKSLAWMAMIKETF